MKHYFAQDGSYGVAEQMVVTDTSKWTDEMWAEIDEASDSDRAALVQSWLVADGVEDIEL